MQRVQTVQNWRQRAGLPFRQVPHLPRVVTDDSRGVRQLPVGAELWKEYKRKKRTM